MRFKVYRLRRNGRRLAWRDALNEAPHVGELVTHLVPGQARAYSAATLRPIGAPVAAASIPDLYEPVLVSMSTLALRLRGYERVEEAGGVRAVLQEWHCEPP